MKKILFKKKFLKSELGLSLQECICSWDTALIILKDYSFRPESEEYCRAKQISDRCEAQWIVFKLALNHFYGIEYCFVRSNDCFGVASFDGSDWLFRIQRFTNLDPDKDFSCRFVGYSYNVGFEHGPFVSFNNLEDAVQCYFLLTGLFDIYLSEEQIMDNCIKCNGYFSYPITYPNGSMDELYISSH